MLGEISFVMTGNTFDRGCGGDLNNGITSEKCVTGSGWEQAGSVSVDDVSDVTTAQLSKKWVFRTRPFAPQGQN